jgi:hypothetical protein
MQALSMKGDAPMTQDIIVWALLAGLVGLIWVMALAIRGNDHLAHDNRQGSASPEQPDGCEPIEGLPRQSRVVV